MPMVWVLYRNIKGPDPTLIDFTSQAAQGTPPSSADPEILRLWDGISCWATEAQARRIARRYPKQGAYIAVLQIPDDTATRIERTRGPGHHTLRGDPAEIMTCVIAVR
jgi:hypothetical protein